MKCDETRPICSACRRSSRHCVYTTNSSQESTSTETETKRASIVTGDVRQVQDRDQQGTVEHAHDNVHSHDAHGTSIVELCEPASSTRVDADESAWVTPQDETQISSPLSTLSGTIIYPANVAPLRWFGLLAGDVSDVDFDFPSPSLFTSRQQQGSFQTAPPSEVANNGFVTGTIPTQESASARQVLSPPPYGAPTVLPKETVTLLDSEMPIFRHFVEHLSLWIDLTDPHRHFAITVPHLALHNPGLMKAILALDARHLSIKPCALTPAPDRTQAVQYYYETLQYLQQAMKVEEYLGSEELIATVLIISTYEMIDGAGKGWERHLKGVFSILRSQDINGESGGLKQAIWWAWLRQDVWAAFRERRRVFSFFVPTKPYRSMDHWDIAARVVYLLAQCVNYSSEQETETGKVNLVARMERADELSAKLQDWYQHLTPHYRPLPSPSPVNSAILPIWINPPVFGKETAASNGETVAHYPQVRRSRCTTSA